MTQVSELRNRLDEICREGGLPVADVSAGTEIEESVHYQWIADESDTSAAASLIDRRYLVASITKPIVATAVLQQIAEGRLGLNQRVADVLPSFDRATLRQITIRHLLTHSSGFPDMLPDNEELRICQAPLSEFLEHALNVVPEFPAGTDCRYSSTGFLVLSAVFEQVVGTPISLHLKEKVFDALGMENTFLGVPPDQADHFLPTVLPCQLPIWQTSPTETDSAQWNWNSRYWRMLGAPWGGLITTARELGLFARMMVNSGCSADGRRILTNLVVDAAMTNQTQSMDSLPEPVRRQQQWSFGWRLNWLNHTACFSELLRETVIGHWGATGTMMWICPNTGRYCTILTTVPWEQSQPTIQRISNVIASVLSDVSF